MQRKEKINSLFPLWSLYWTKELNRGKNSPSLFSRKLSRAGPRKPCPGFRVCWWDDIRALHEGGADSPSLLETPLDGIARSSCSLFSWIPCQWPIWALGRRNPGTWVPQWPPLLMTSSSEIWSSIFWRGKWERPAEPSSWSWPEGKDSGLRMSSGRTPLIWFVNQFYEELPWNPRNSCFLREEVMCPSVEQVWNQRTNLSQVVVGNKMSVNWIQLHRN